ncbi:MAG: diguanylate cyclase [Lachnospiraceae bacterium]|nr:diguanylate cyclase [Lachnospiraceae bacterium]
MKKKVAVFANTWNADIVSSFLSGYTDSLDKETVDTFIFLAANSYGRPENNNLSEVSIHSLPDLTTFDAAIVFSQGLNSNPVRDKIYENCEKAGIPTFCIGDFHPGFHGVMVKTANAMKELCDHLYEEHNARKFVFFGGPKDNGDSNARLEAVKEYAKDKGLDFTEDDIFYTNWEVRKCMTIIEERFSDKESLPDAMIFANDFLAMSAVMSLEVLGIKVPEDVMVTGFDFARTGQRYYPSISTINQRFDLMGEFCAKSIEDIFAGKEVPFETYIDGAFKAGESCGCHNPRNEDVLRREYCHRLVGKEFEDNYRMGIIYGIRAAFQESSKFATLPAKLQNALYYTINADCDNYYVLFDPTIERIATEEPEELPKFTYANKLEVVVSKKHGKPLRTDYTICKTEIVPEYDGEGENEVFFVMPLYIDTFVVGYFIMTQSVPGIRDWVYQDYQSCFIQSLTYYKTNLRLAALNEKLSELMQKDALTSLKNRTAFENAKAQLRNHYLADDGTRFAVVMFDLNNLKEINDEYGHGMGDIYIKNSSMLICNTFKHSPVYRIGGDEFVAIVKNDDYDKKEELLQEFRKVVAELSNPELPPEKRVSVAAGMADYDEIENENIDSVFKKADDRMYENKRKMKAELGLK